MSIAVYLRVALARMTYPFAIEWEESAMADHLIRIASGEPVYAAPTHSFIALPYPPLYAHLAALVDRVVADELLALRLVSFVASLGVLLILYAWARREGAVPWLAVLAPGFYALLFARAGAWFDVGRVDSAFLCLVLGTLFVLRVSKSPLTGVLAGVLGLAAFFTKQTALPILGPFIAVAPFVRGRGWRSFAVIFGVGALVGTLWLDVQSGGWYRFHVFEVLAGHPIVARRLLTFWTHDMIGTVPVALALVGVVGLAGVRAAAERPLRSLPVDDLFLPVAWVGCAVASWMSRAHFGGFANVLMPVHALTALGAAVGLARMLEPGWLSRAGQPANPGVSRATAVGLVAAMLLQWAWVAYDPTRFVPTELDREAGEALVRRLEQIEGPVWSPIHTDLARRAGHPGSAHLQAILDIRRSGESEGRRMLEASLSEAMGAHHWAAILLDRPRLGVAREYERSGRSFERRAAFWPVTGYKIRPEWLWRPREMPRQGKTPRSGEAAAQGAGGAEGEAEPSGQPPKTTAAPGMLERATR